MGHKVLLMCFIFGCVRGILQIIYCRPTFSGITHWNKQRIEENLGGPILFFHDIWCELKIKIDLT